MKKNCSAVFYYCILFSVIIIWGLDPTVYSFLYRHYSAAVLCCISTLASFLLFLALSAKRLKQINFQYIKPAVTIGLLNAVAHFDDGISTLVNLVFKALLDGLLCFFYILYGIYRNTLCQCSTTQSAEHLTNTYRVTGNCGITAVRSGLGDLSRKGSRSHLSTGHTVDCIVDKDNGNVLTTGSSMYGLCSTDCCKVAVALIGKYYIVRE